MLFAFISFTGFSQGPHSQRDTIPLGNSYICDTFLTIGGTQVYIAIQPTHLIKWNYSMSNGVQACNWKYRLEYYIESTTNFYTLQGTVNNTNFFNLPNSGCTNYCTGVVYTANNSASNCSNVNFSLSDQVRIEIHNADISSRQILMNCNAFTVLSVQLSEFTGVKNGRANQLDWTTLSEYNNDFFLLERSVNGTDWEYVASINGAGTTDQQQEYTYEDYAFGNDVNYYRLSQTDYDGQTKKFNIIKIDNSGSSKTLERIVNLMGEEVSADYNGVKLYVYSDGEVVKRF